MGYTLKTYDELRKHLPPRATDIITGWPVGVTQTAVPRREGAGGRGVEEHRLAPGDPGPARDRMHRGRSGQRRPGGDVPA